MAVPDYQSLMLPVLKKSADGEVRIGTVVETLADELKLSDEDRAELLPSGRQTTFANRVHWAKTYLKQAGLVESTRRAHFKITDRGQTVLAEKPERIDVNFLSRFPEFTEFRERQTPADDGYKLPANKAGRREQSQRTPEDEIRSAHHQLNASYQRREILTPVGFPNRRGSDSRLAKEICHAWNSSASI